MKHRIWPLQVAINLVYFGTLVAVVRWSSTPALVPILALSALLLTALIAQLMGRIPR